MAPTGPSVGIPYRAQEVRMKGALEQIALRTRLEGAEDVLSLIHI